MLLRFSSFCQGVAFRHNLRDRCGRCRTIISQEEGTYMVKRGENGHESREYAGLGERTNGEGRVYLIWCLPVLYI